MTAAAQILSALEARGAWVRLRADGLISICPESALTSALRAEIKTHRDALALELEVQAQEQAAREPHIGLRPYPLARFLWAKKAGLTVLPGLNVPPPFVTKPEGSA